MRYQKKGEIWISAVLYLLIISIVMAIVLEAGIPLMSNLRDKSLVIQVRDSFIAIDQHIQEISDAGPGSQRVIPLEIKKGELEIDSGRLKWKFDTEADVLEPGTSQKSGNLRIGSNADVSATEGSETYVLENSYIRATFNKIGNSSSYKPINSTALIRQMKFVKTGGTVNGTFTFQVNAADISGNGYTAMQERGFDLQTATVLFHVNQSGSATDISVTLHANEDFLRVKIE